MNNISVEINYLKSTVELCHFHENQRAYFIPDPPDVLRSRPITESVVFDATWLNIFGKNVLKINANSLCSCGVYYLYISNIMFDIRAMVEGGLKSYTEVVIDPKDILF